MNKTNQNILDFLTYYCTHKGALRYAVLINGKWGAGKTHLVRQFLAEHSDLEFLYVSLYGMKDISDIEDAFFAQLHPVLAHKGMKIAGAVLKGLLRGGLKIDLKELEGFKASADVKGGEIGVPGFLKSATGRVLVFDDLERADMPLRKLMGYINTFVEHDDSKVILIANEEELTDAERGSYNKTKEKLVGKTFSIEVDFPTAVEEFIKSVEEAEVRQFFAIKRGKLETLFRQSETNNLRILQQGLWDFERLAMQLTTEQRRNTDAMDAIFGPFMSLFFEIRAGRCEPGDLKGLDGTNWLRVFAQRKREEGKSKQELLQDRYPEVRYEDTIIGMDVIGDALFKSALNSDTIKERVAASRLFAGPADTPSWKRLWHHWDLPDQEIETACEDVEREFNAREFTNPGEILHVFGLRLWLAEVGKIKIADSEVTKECRQYVDDLVKDGRLPAADAGRDRSDGLGRSYNGLGYYKNETQNWKELYLYLAEARQRVLEGSYPAQAKGLLNRMLNDADEFSSDLNSRASGSGKYMGIPILSYTDPVDFVRRVLSMDKSRIHTAILSFKTRYNYLRSYPDLAAELGWLREVEALLLAEAETKEPITKADLKSLIQYNITEPRAAAEEAAAAIASEKHDNL